MSINGNNLRRVKDFYDALKEYKGEFDQQGLENAWDKFIKSRNWDKLHPREGVKVLEHTKKDYMEFFKQYQKTVIQYPHMELDLLK